MDVVDVLDLRLTVNASFIEAIRPLAVYFRGFISEDFPSNLFRVANEWGERQVKWSRAITQA